MLSIQQLIDDVKCYDTVRQERWPDGVRCPHCESDDVVNTEGTINRVEYLPPFAYLQSVRDRLNEATEDTSENSASNETDSPGAACSNHTLDCGSSRIRTCDRRLMRPLF